jgi:hypothetical protein
MNAVAKLWGFFAEAMLGPSDLPVAPPAPTELPAQETFH